MSRLGQVRKPIYPIALLYIAPLFACLPFTAYADACRPGDQAVALPAEASIYSSDSLLESTPSRSRPNETVCVDSATLARSSRSLTENPVEPVRAYLASAPEVPLSVRREYINRTGEPSPSEEIAPSTRARVPASDPVRETTRPRLSSVNRSTLLELDPSASCGGINLPPLPPRVAPNPEHSSEPIPDISVPGVPAGPDEEEPSEPTQSTPPGGTSLGGATSGSIPSDLLPHLERLSANDRRSEFYGSLIERRNELRESALADTQVLQGNWQEAPLDEMESRFTRARDSLSEQSAQVSLGKSRLSSGEQLRFSRQLQSASERAEIARQFTRTLQDRITRENERASLAGKNPVMNFLLVPDKTRNPLSRSSDLELLFGKSRDAAAATTADGLAQRLVMLQGLDSSARQRALEQLQLSEPISFTLPSGQSVDIPLLHNGYILGGGKTGLDCSSFVSDALPADIRKGTFTTWDFRTMWAYRRTGVPPRDPRYEEKRLSQVLEVSKAFDALDLYRGDEPAVGDLLVHRLPWETTGHVFVVREWHRDTKIASVIEASQSAGTIREREFPLSLDDPSRGKLRLIRPGLMLMRIRPVQQRVCTFRRASDRAPASVGAETATAAAAARPGTPYRGGAD